MKKTYKSSLLALSVLASFTSCSESESLQQANLSKDKITFHATLDNSWKPHVSRFLFPCCHSCCHREGTPSSCQLLSENPSISTR